MSAQPQLHPPGQLFLPNGRADTPLVLSHSRKQTMVTCGRKYELQYVRRLEPIAQAAALVFGSAMDRAVSECLTAFGLGLQIDPAPIFEASWKKALAERPVQFSQLWTPEEMLATGQRLVQLFAEDWPQRGWTVVLDRNGVPIVQRELRVKLPNGDTYTSILDVLVRDAQQRVLLVDVKTPAQVAMEGFASISDQLLGQQMVVDANAAALGIGKVDGLVFYELVKKKMPKTSRGEGPVVHVAEPAAPRSVEDVNAFVGELMFVARDIRDKRFAKRSSDAFDTSCALCFAAPLCLSGDASGLQVRAPSNFNRNKLDENNQQVSF